MLLKSKVKNGAIWDGDIYSIKYYGVSKNFTTLNRGRNTITLSPDPIVVRGTKLTVEVLDRNGKELKVEYPNQILPNGDIILYVTVEDDTPSGLARFYILGTAYKDVDTNETLDISKPNVLWRGISKIKRINHNDDIDQPDDIVFENPVGDIEINVTGVDHTYIATEDRPTVYTGSNLLTYYPVLEPSNYSPNVLLKKTTKTTELSRPITDASGSQATTVLGEPLLDSKEYPSIKSTEEVFTSDMVGGIITTQPDVASYVPGNLSGLVGSIPSHSSTILEVVNSTLIRVDDHFYHSIPNSPSNYVVNRYNSNSYQIKYNKSGTQTPGQKITGYAKICFSNVATSNGKVDKVRVYAKPVGSIGQAMLLGDYDLDFPSKIEDSTEYVMNPRKGLEYKTAGAITTGSDVTKYFDYEEYVVNRNAADSINQYYYDPTGNSISTPSATSEFLMESISTSAPVTQDYVTAISTKDGYSGTAKAGTEYKISFKSYSQKDVTGKTPSLKVFVSGVDLELPYDTSNQFGALVEDIEGGNGSTKEHTIVIKANSDSDNWKVYFVLESGRWDISNFNIVPTSTTNNTPNEFCILVPLDNLPVGKIDEEYVFIIEFIGENGKPTTYRLTTQSLTLNSNTTLDQTLIINTFNSSTLIQNTISGSFNEASASLNNYITNISGSLIYSGSWDTPTNTILLHRHTCPDIPIQIDISGSGGGYSGWNFSDTSTCTLIDSGCTVTFTGSQAIEFDILNSFTGSISLNTGSGHFTGGIKTFINNENVISGSINYGDLVDPLWFKDGVKSVSPSGSNVGCNILLGINSGNCITTGQRNIMAGTAAGFNTTTGNCNVFLGLNAGVGNTTGCSNIAIGTQAAMGVITGRNNIVIGTRSATDLTAGVSNIFLGAGSMCNLTSGSYNVAIGQSVGGINYTGSYSVLLGYLAGSQETKSNRLHISNSANPLIYGEFDNERVHISGSLYVEERTGTGGMVAAFDPTTKLYETTISASDLTTLIDDPLWYKDGVSALSPSGSTLSKNYLIGTNVGENLSTGCSNIGIGAQTMCSNQTGCENVMVGSGAGRFNTSGGYNTYLGGGAGALNLGSHNTFVGQASGYGTSSPSGGCNTSLGAFSGNCIESGAHNVFLGYSAGTCNASGSCNVFIGSCSGFNELGSNRLYIGNSPSPLLYGEFDNEKVHVSGSLFVEERTGTGGMLAAFNPVTKLYETTISASDVSTLVNDPLWFKSGTRALMQSGSSTDNNVFIGCNTGNASTSTHNIGIGYQSLLSNTTGNSNIAIGNSTLGDSINTGCNNIAIGSWSSRYIQSNFNVSIGWYALTNNNNAVANNIAIGCTAGRESTGYFNVFMGSGAGLCAIGNNSSVLGYNSGQYAGTSAVFVGEGSGRYNSGNYNIGIGYYALCGISGSSTGIQNIGIGTQAGLSITNCTCNTYVGYQSGLYHTGGSNTGLGSGALRGSLGNSSGEFNVALGSNALYQNRAANNSVAIGVNSLYSNQGGNNNVGVGFSTLFNNISGLGNVAIGREAGYNSTGDYNVFLGYQAGCNETGNQRLHIGTTPTTTLLYGEFDNEVVHISGSLFVEERTGADGMLAAFNPVTKLYETTISASDVSTLVNDPLWFKDGIRALSPSGSATDDNILLGQEAGNAITSGTCNIAIGKYSIGSNLTGISNVGIGFYTGNKTLGSYNTFLNYQAGRYQEGAHNIGVGYLSMQGVLGSSTGGNNVAIGKQSQQNLTTGGNNVSIGDRSLENISGGNHNIAIGACSGDNVGNGISNIFLGLLSGCVTVGNNNVYIGQESGKNQSSNDNIGIGIYSLFGVSGSSDGTDNVAIGCFAGYSMTSGVHNTFLNTRAGFFTAGGNFNIALGDTSLYCNISGGHNIALGYQSVRSATTAESNIGIGREALYATDRGCNIGIGCLAGQLGRPTRAVFIGAQAGRYSDGQLNTYIGELAGCGISGSSSGNFNTFIGFAAGREITTGDNNFGVGCIALCNIKSGASNIALGLASLGALSNNSSNIAIGSLSGRFHQGLGAVYIGHNAGCGFDANYNVFIGYQSGLGVSGSSTGTANVGLGYRTGFSLTSGYQNTLVGHQSGQYINTGYYNTTLGAFALQCDEDGYQNTAIGPLTLRYNVSGDVNTAVGYAAGEQQRTGFGTFLGFGAGRNFNASCNTFIGYAAGIGVSGSSCGGGNVSLGVNSAYNLTSGGCNVLLGPNAGCNLTTESNQLHISNSPDPLIYGEFDNEVVHISGSLFVEERTGADGMLAAFNPVTKLYETTISASDVSTLVNDPLWFKCGTRALMQSGSNVGCNIALGEFAGNDASVGTDNVFLGRSAGCLSQSSFNVYIGCHAGIGQLGSSTGLGNIAIGCLTGTCITTGYSNVLIGRATACKITTGNTNVIIGNNSGAELDEGIQNVMIGGGAGQFSSGSGAQYNVFIGNGAGQRETNRDNVVIGRLAGQNTGGIYNTFMHLYAGQCLTGTGNLGLGYHSLRYAQSSNYNLAIGFLSMGETTGSSDYNIAIGRESMENINCGNSNISMGYQSMHGQGLGSETYCSIALGHQSLFNITTGIGNEAIGYRALCSNENGSYNIGLGWRAGEGNLSGNYNTFIGYLAGYLSTGSFSSNVGIGFAALQKVLVSNTVGIGYAAGCSLTTGACNTIVGDRAGQSITTEFGNTFIGAFAGANAAGNSNTLIGESVGRNCSPGAGNTAIGYRAGWNLDGEGNVFLGRCAGYFETGNNKLHISNTAGPLIYGEFDNEVVHISGSLYVEERTGTGGLLAAFDPTTKLYQTSISASDLFTLVDEPLWFKCGNRALIQTGSSVNCNIALGNLSMEGATTGRCNVALGANTLCSVADGNDNVAIGINAGMEQTLDTSVFIGGYAGQFQNAIWNTFVGFGSGVGCTGNSTGFGNAALGTYSGYRLTTGCLNTFFGLAAGCTITTGDCNVFIGTGAGQGLTTESNKLIIANSGDPLIYGEFDNEVVHISGSLYVRDTTSSAPNQGVIAMFSGSRLVKSSYSASNAGWDFCLSGSCCGTINPGSGLNFTTTSELYLSEPSPDTILIGVNCIYVCAGDPIFDICANGISCTGNVSEGGYIDITGGSNVTVTGGANGYSISAANDNNYLCAASFNTGTGTLTLCRFGLSPLPLSLDGRYCTTDTTYTAGNGLGLSGTNLFLCVGSSLSGLHIVSDELYIDAGAGLDIDGFNTLYVKSNGFGIDLDGSSTLCVDTTDFYDSSTTCVTSTSYFLYDKSSTTFGAHSQFCYSGAAGTFFMSGTLCVSGNAYAGGVLLTSDKRLKTNIENINSGLCTIKSFCPYTFCIEGIPHSGFIAQEVCSVLPHTVLSNHDGFLNLNYIEILPYMHSAILELEQCICKLEKKLDEKG